MENCYSCGEKLIIINDKPYQYNECGLDVALCGIAQFTCPSCGESYASIPNIQKLHRTIGSQICEKRKSLLQHAEIKFLRKDLHLRAKELAEILGVTPQTVSLWENGKKEIGETHDRLFRSIYMMYASEQAQHVIGQGFIDIFKDLPAKRKKIERSKEICLTPQEWLGNLGNLCNA